VIKIRTSFLKLPTLKLDNVGSFRKKKLDLFVGVKRKRGIKREIAADMKSQCSLSAVTCF
jgi:hypothetical protein